MSNSKATRTEPQPAHAGVPCCDPKPAPHQYSQTHLDYIKQVADIVIDRLPADERNKLDAQLTYSLGRPGLRGITYHEQWQNGGDTPVPFIEICALGEENDVQLAGTAIHELGHVLAGVTAGHSKDWKNACERLGLRKPKAAGNVYHMSQFDPDVRLAIAALISPTDGKPVGIGGALGTGRQPIKPKPCPAGIGTRGGKTRGKGSGSRLRKFVCECNPPVIVRAGRNELRATCMECDAQFMPG